MQMPPLAKCEIADTKSIEKALGTRFHEYDGKGSKLVIPACCKRESSDFDISEQDSLHKSRLTR